MSLPATMDESSSGLLAHLKARDTTYVRVSRAPYPTLAAAKAAHGRTFPPQLHLTPQPVSSQDYDGQGEISGLPPMPVGSGVPAADRPAHQPA